MQQPPKKTLLTPERTMEVADSLEVESIKKKGIGNANKKIAEAFIAKGKGNETLVKGLPGGKDITASERLEKSKKDLESAAKDKSNADRYRRLALNSMKKK